LELLNGALCAIETSGEHADAQAGVVTAIRSSYHRRTGGEGPPGGWWIYVEPTILLSIRDVFRTT
jgi:hypothetical protein